MAEKNRFSKPVAFNKTNAEDQKILKHVARRNFSGYVKKLILEDIRRGGETKGQIKAVDPVKTDDPKPVVVEQPKPSAADRLAALKEKQKRPGASEPKPYLLTNKGINGQSDAVTND